MTYKQTERQKIPQTYYFDAPKNNEGVEFVLQQLITAQQSKGYIVSSHQQCFSPYYIGQLVKSCIVKMSRHISEEINDDDFNEMVVCLLEESCITKNGNLRVACAVALWNMYKNKSFEWSPEHEATLDQLSEDDDSYEGSIPVFRGKIKAKITHAITPLKTPQSKDG